MDALMHSTNFLLRLRIFVQRRTGKERKAGGAVVSLFIILPESLC